jgi:protein involved in polysaccharide export with SLBB domain
MARRRRYEENPKPTTWALIIGGVALAGGALYLALRKPAATASPSTPTTPATPPATAATAPTTATPSASRPTYSMVAANKQIALRIGDVLEVTAPHAAQDNTSWNAYSSSPGLNPGDQNDSVQPLYNGPTVGLPALFVAAHAGPATIVVNLSEVTHGGEIETYTIHANVSA